MKKILLLVVAVVAVTMMSCLKGTDYKAKGEEFARQLDELCNKQDAQAVLALEDSIRQEEEAIAATGDSAAIADFAAALKASRERNARYLSVLKMESGEDKDSIAQDLVQDVMNDRMSLEALTSSIDTMLRNEAQKKKKASNK